jgi:predicted alpha/beta hydrolase family esterase
MKKQVFYIHGGCAFSEYEEYISNLKNTKIDLSYEDKKRWTKTLTEDLGENFEVISPIFPSKYNAHYEEWKIWFENHFEHLRDDVILVGWSLGSMFLQKYLANNDLPVKIQALFLLASPHEYFKDKTSGEDGGDFNLDTTNDVSQIANKVNHIVLMHSKDDFVVPYEHTIKLYEKLPTAELVTFSDKNHFLVEELPELVERIKQLR